MYPLTIQGFLKIKESLTVLKQQRPQVIFRVKEAREQGDLRENVGYQAAKEDQAFLEGKISELSQIVQQAYVVNTSFVSDKSRISFGAKIRLAGDIEGVFQLVSDIETRFLTDTISLASPLGKALLGKSIGDSIQLKDMAYVIKEIHYT